MTATRFLKEPATAAQPSAGSRRVTVFAIAVRNFPLSSLKKLEALYNFLFLRANYNQNEQDAAGAARPKGLTSMNRKNNRTFRGFIRKNGFYVAMVMFVVAGAIASYAAVTSIIGGSQPLTELDPETEIVQNEPEDPVQVEPEITPEQAEEPVQEPAQQEAQQAAAGTQEPILPSYTRPVGGEMLKPFSNGELVRSETMNDWRTHNGADYAAAVGDPVTAVYSGEVTRAEQDPSLGYVIEMKLDSGYHVLYANLADCSAVQVGQRIVQGETIGTVGDSALIERAELPHLHFEARSGEKRIDPETLFDN